MPGKMSLDEIHAFLDSRPGWIALTTMSADGYPHTVAIGYFRVGDEVYIGGRAGTQKMLNVQRNPHVTVMLESGTSMADIKGVMIQGDGTVLDSMEDLVEMSRAAARARGVPEEQLPTQARPGAAYIKLVPKRYISWDYSKEG